MAKAKLKAKRKRKRTAKEADRISITILKGSDRLEEATHYLGPSLRR